MYPILLSIGFIKIYSYGMFLAIAFIIGLNYLRKKALVEGINSHQMMDLGLYILISAIIGSRALYIMCNYQYYLKNPLEIILLTKGGLIFYGGLILALLVGIVFIKKKGLPLWKIMDLVASSLVLGQSIGRIGCFLSGCCYGKPTQMLLGIKFSTYSVAYCHFGDNSLHPTQIYDSIASLLIFIILNWKLKYRSFAGEVLVWYLVLYPVARFVIELFRGDNPAFIFSLTMSQIISILLLLLSIFLWLKLRKNPLKTSSKGN
ncbi:MAG: prolipoprotein diacylglyceryl transferase [bacterium]|nr:prolipoprotein diacylglyceryl transferase [bacterium]